MVYVIYSTWYMYININICVYIYMEVSKNEGPPSPSYLWPFMVLMPMDSNSSVISFMGVAKQQRHQYSPAK